MVDNFAELQLSSLCENKEHSIILDGLKILENLTHRGAVGADPTLGDGAGLLLQIPDQFLREECKKHDVILPKIQNMDVKEYIEGIEAHLKDKRRRKTPGEIRTLQRELNRLKSQYKLQQTENINIMERRIRGEGVKKKSKTNLEKSSCF